jgi:hypothetical protein
LKSKTLLALGRAGWAEDRHVADEVLRWDRALLEEGFAMHPAARQALTRFGGLRLRQRGLGETMPIGDIDLDPLLALGERDRFEVHEAVIGTRLYPLGGHYFLAIATDGNVFTLMEDIVLVGASIEEALDNLVAGRTGASSASRTS